MTRGGSKQGRGCSPTAKSLAPCGRPVAPSKVNDDAGILLNYVVIASNVYMWTTFYVYCV